MRELYEKASRDAQSWQRAVMSPIETQVRDHQVQLRRRADAVRRVHEASDGLEARIGEIEAERLAIESEQRIFESNYVSLVM